MADDQANMNTGEMSSQDKFRIQEEEDQGINQAEQTGEKGGQTQTNQEPKQEQGQADEWPSDLLDE